MATSSDFDIRAREVESVDYNPPSLLTIDQADDVTCSFAGGCSLSVTAPGLTAALRNSDENSITVCGNVCELDSSSDEGIATCSLPPLVTPFSVEDYKLATSTLLQGQWTGTGDDDERAKLNDGNPTVNFQDSGSSCELTFTESRSDYVYNIEEVGIYITSLDNVAPYIGKLRF